MEYQGSVLREGVYYGECPRWHDGRLWYSDFFDHAVHALAPGGDDERVVELAAQPAGLGWMPDGSLLIVSMLDRRVLRLGADGSLGEHADLAQWAPFHCNDMVVDAAGRAYVGNFGFDIYPLLAGEPAGARPAALIRVDPGGQVSVVAEGLEFPNGTVITPDGSTLIVAESLGRRLTAFDICGRRGTEQPPGVGRSEVASDHPGRHLPGRVGSGVGRRRPGGNADRRRGRGAGYGHVLPDLYCVHAGRTRWP